MHYTEGMAELFVLVVCVIISIIVGGFVFLQAPRNRVNFLFGLLTVAFTAMTIANYYSLHSSSQLLFIRLVILCTSLIGLLLVGMTYLMTNARASYVWWLTYGALTVLALIVDITPLGFNGVRLNAGGMVTPIPSAGIALFGLHFIVSTIIAGAVLRNAKNKSRVASVRHRFTFIQVGMVPALVFAPITGFIIPVLLQDAQFVILTPLYVVFFLAMVGYAVVRHGLFNVRQTAIRTFAYLLSVASMAVIYFGLAYVVSALFFKDNVTTGISVSPVNIMLALVLAFLFQPVKQFFDHWTNRFFYRDRYDANEFIARLGKVLTSSSRLEAVLELAAAEITSTLKAEGALFVVYRDNQDDGFVGTKSYDAFDEEEQDDLRQLVVQHGHAVFVVDDDQTARHGPGRRLNSILIKRHVALVLPLAGADELVGYLLLGEQLGSNYTERDVAVLEAIADELVITIQNARSVEEIRDLNLHLKERINNATKELRSSNKRLIELDATKDEFISMASHQLRTPLTSIKGYLSMVLEGDAGKISPDQERLLSEAYTSSERMVHLIGDFLNVSRLQTGRFTIEAHECDLATVVAQEVESINPVAAAHSMKLRYRKPSRFPILMVDEDKLRQVIMNFIDNAIYYSPANSEISIQLSVQDGMAVLEVKDHGIGVPADVKDRLFTKFFRADNARKQRPDGTGIGLYLAKKIIDVHGGSVLFESELDHGSTFGFRLPIKKLEP